MRHVEHETTTVPCGMCAGTGVEGRAACPWCDGEREVEALGRWMRLEHLREILDNTPPGMSPDAEGLVRAIEEVLGAS